MTELLDKAFADASKLPKSQQDELAAWILGKLAARRQRQDQVSTADRVAEGAAGYHRPAQGLSLGEAELKGLIKQPLLELLQERGDLVRELVAQTVEDAAMARAIDEGMATESVSKEVVLHALEVAR